jgi:hypothetical protein
MEPMKSIHFKRSRSRNSAGLLDEVIDKVLVNEIPLSVSRAHHICGIHLSNGAR